MAYLRRLFMLKAEVASQCAQLLQLVPVYGIGLLLYVSKL